MDMLAYDRIEVPVFYTYFNDHEVYQNSAYVHTGTVLTQSSQAGSVGWICCGYVSRQTPFGQGYTLGLRPRELRVSTPEEILAALEEDHPNGKDYIPIDNPFPLDRWKEIITQQTEAIKASIAGK